MKIPQKISRIKQEGVTLLLSILMLSSISAVAFSLAAVSLIEVRTSGDVQRTEPIFYSDHGIAEEAVFALKRKVGVSSFGVECSNNFVTYPAPDTTVTSQTKICQLAPGVVVVKIPASANTYDSAKRLYMFDPTPGNQGTGAGNYDDLEIKNVSVDNASVGVFICKLNEECDIPAYGNSPWIVGTTTGPDVITQNQTKDYSGVIDVDSSYEISIINNSSLSFSPPRDLYIQVTTRNNLGQLYGLPYLNKKKIEIQSTRSGLTRRVEVLVPTQ